MSKDSIILFVGTYPPRECGIATFTHDISKAVKDKYSKEFAVKILAMNKNGTNIYNYPKEVIMQMSDNDIGDYIKTARKINKNDKIKLVCIQHEFGIFGGEYGSYLVTFLELLNKPVVITFHSVIPNPDPMLKKTVQTISQRCGTIIVMNKKGKGILRNEYGLKTDIAIVPHGIPTVPFVSSERKKNKMGLKDKKIISSFGMINRGKGYEYVIEALPNLINKFPDLLYIIVGETHPVVRKEEGEEYRLMLERKVTENNLKKHVKFYNKYVLLEEIVDYLVASDIYISSGLNPDQITSGTLSYAMGAGRAVISTPFLHALDYVTPERGRLVKFKNKKSFESAIDELLSNDLLRNKMGKNNYAFTRKMVWPVVAQDYIKIFNKNVSRKNKIVFKIPQINLSHVKKMTDNIGLIQFANGIVQDKSSGYALDDNARALIVASECYSIFDNKKEVIPLLKKYLGFIEKTQEENGKLFNIVDENGNVIYDQWSDDALGRGLWGLGSVFSNKDLPINLRKRAQKIFDKAIIHMEDVSFPKSISFALIGLCNYNSVDKDQKYIKELNYLADKLSSMYKENSSKEWKWFEKMLTYSNGKVPEAILYAYEATKNKKYLDIGLESLDFLISITFENGMFVPVGHEGWFYKDGQKAYFDQQPVDAASMVNALKFAHKLTGNDDYLEKAFIAFQWFLGRNMLNCKLYDEKTGGCFDGLGKASINFNQGAESTLSYLLARTTIQPDIKDSRLTNLFF